MRVLPYGERALLVEWPEGSVIALRAALAGTPGIGEMVPAARTLLVPFDPRQLVADALEVAITAAVRTAGTEPRADLGPPITLGVHYDGPDLTAVAEYAGCDIAEVIRRHCAGDYVVAFCGFAPGFAYLTGLHPSLQLPRLARPRSSVAAGAVGVAGEFTAAYPRSSPGGWRLIGHTDAPLWQLDRDPPALLTPGRRVRFEPL